MSLAWPMHKAGLREDVVRAESALIVPEGAERFELWVEGQQSRPFIRVTYIDSNNEGGYHWTEREEVYCRLSDLPEELRQQIHSALAEKLVPEFDAKQRAKYKL